MATTRDPVFKSLEHLDSRKWGLIPRPPSLEANTLPLSQQGRVSNNNNNNNRIQRRNSRLFFQIISLCRELSPTCILKWPECNRVQITSNTSSAYHVHHIECLSRATCHVLCHVVRRDSSAIKTELKSHLFELYLIGRTIKPMKEGRKPEYPEQTPASQLMKMPHTTV